jgi:hypothetical protein
MARTPKNTPVPEDPAAASAEVTAPAPETTGTADAAIDPGAAPGTPDGAVAAGGPSLITVVGPAKGRWRAGWHFGPTATVIPADQLTEAQIAALNADPELTVITS